MHPPPFRYPQHPKRSVSVPVKNPNKNYFRSPTKHRGLASEAITAL
ncbi:MAG TPA: hypothetical protein V6D43_22555 [Candidatus Sericytochromatia bacterium]